MRPRLHTRNLFIRIKPLVARSRQCRCLSSTSTRIGSKPLDESENVRAGEDRTTHFGFETITESLKGSKGRYGVPTTDAHSLKSPLDSSRCLQFRCKLV